jgi:hypothetical protein
MFEWNMKADQNALCNIILDGKKHLIQFSFVLHKKFSLGANFSCNWEVVLASTVNNYRHTIGTGKCFVFSICSNDKIYILKLYKLITISFYTIAWNLYYFKYQALPSTKLLYILEQMPSIGTFLDFIARA